MASEQVSGEGPNAGEERRKLITFWHARGHDKLDRFGVPRFEDGMELMIEERIERLALLGAVTEQPRPAPGICPAPEERSS